MPESGGRDRFKQEFNTRSGKILKSTIKCFIILSIIRTSTTKYWFPQAFWLFFTRLFRGIIAKAQTPIILLNPVDASQSKRLKLLNLVF